MSSTAVNKAPVIHRYKKINKKWQKEKPKVLSYHGWSRTQDTSASGLSVEIHLRAPPPAHLAAPPDPHLLAPLPHHLQHRGHGWRWAASPFPQPPRLDPSPYPVEVARRSSESDGNSPDPVVKLVVRDGGAGRRHCFPEH